MTRVLLLALLVLFVAFAVRRALAAGRRSARPPTPTQRGARPGGGASAKGKSLPPDHLVCGACGHDFEPEQSGWICPRCGK